jgi:ribosomal protein S18 acetylase RimI-like enzyme
MDKIIIREATNDDLPVLLQFEQEIFRTERPFEKTLKDGEPHYYDIAELIASPQANVLVAEVENELAGSGYALIKEAEPYVKHDQYAHLGFMYVKPAYRGRGINKQILQALKQWVIEKGITEIRLFVYEENTIAKNAYLKAGFKPSLVEMRMEVGG